ncbi:MAG: M56 family metallopeptidase [Cyclobacteriaceae bacterium]
MDFLSYFPSLQRLLEALGLTLLHSLWQGLLLMLIFWGLLRLISQQRANLRFVLALSALFILLTAFAVTFYYEWESLQPVAVVSQELNAIELPLTEYTVSTEEPTLWQQIQREANALFFQLSENAVWMAGLWLLGSLFFSARLGLGLWQVRQFRQQRNSLPEHWQQIASGLQQKLGIRRKVSFSCSERLDSPLTLGWLKPVILLPSAMLMAMPADQLESILVHELAHIRRHDYLWNLLQSLAEVVLFYHPAYWYMASVLEQERELACDAITLQVTGRPQVYAQALLQVAALRTTFSPVALSDI